MIDLVAYHSVHDQDERKEIDVHIAPATTNATTTNAAPARGDQPRARYGGVLTVEFPEGHWTEAKSPEGDWLPVPFVLVGQVGGRGHASLTDAIRAAQQVSRGERDAVAVVRDPGTGDAGPWRIERILVNDHHRWQRWSGVDLEGVVAPGKPDDPWWVPSAPDFDVHQPLSAQRTAIVGAVVDGELVLDRIDRYQSKRPDLPGRNPDRPTG